MQTYANGRNNQAQKKLDRDFLCSHFRVAAILVAATFTLGACSGARSEGIRSPAPSGTPVAESTTAPPRLLAPTPPFDPGAPFVAVPSQPQPAPTSLPTAVPPLSTPTVAPSAPTPPRPAKQLTITQQDDRKTVKASVGDLILIKLGNDFRWVVQSPDASMLMPASASLPVGAQALYVAVRAGPIELSATGTANCPPGVACPLFAIPFKVDLVIH